METAPPSAVDEPNWSRFRAQMPVTQRWAYFDHAAVAPLTSAALEALAQWGHEAAHEGDTVWPRWSRQLEQTRRQAASLLAAQDDEIALVPSTTAGISLVAEGYPWKPGDNVVTLANEFPSNQYPWMNLASRGVQTRRVPVEGVCVDLNRVERACDDRTRVIAVSWVGYASGWRIDVRQFADLAHRRGALLFLDAIQGLGVFPLDVQQSQVDFLAADGHKWLLGPEGAGIFFCRREHLDLLRPLGVGWHSVAHAQDFSRVELILRDSAARYEGGSHNMAGFLALGASLQLLQGFGLGPRTSAIERRVLQVTERACQRLREIGAHLVSDRGPHHRSGIVAFQLPGQDPTAVRQRCLRHHVALGCRGGALRISPHAYVNDDDVERLIQSLADDRAPRRT